MGEGHVHELHAGDALAHAAQGALEQAGQQWTPMRAAVFAALSGFARPASAYDVADAVSREQGRRIVANSVYRILDLFVETNLVTRVETANAYIANAHPGCRHDCIFLLCDRCGEAVHLDDDRLTGGVRDVAAAAGFRPDRPVIEVRGRCATCHGSA